MLYKPYFQEESPTLNELTHHGVLGMKWGVRKDRPSRSERKIMNSAKKDAQKFVEARVSRGEGAGNKRKQIKTIVEQRRKQSELYGKTFDDAINYIDGAKAVNRAERWRAKEDVKSQAKSSTKDVAQVLTGTSSLATAGILYMRYKPQVDAFVRSAYSTLKKTRL
jgi:hypothetical protein